MITERVNKLLNDEVTKVTGVGEKTANDLAMLEIYTIQDLLYYFPMKYDVYEIKPLEELIHDDQVTIYGVVVNNPVLNFYGKGRSRLTFMIEVDHVAVKAVMFNRAFAKKQIKHGDTVTLTGIWDAHRLQITVNYYKKGSPKNDDEINTKYSLKENITNGRLKKIIRQAVKQYEKEINEFLPKSYLNQYKLPSRVEAIETLHFPKNRQALKHARRRLIYEELLLFQLKMQLLRKMNRQKSPEFAQQMDRIKIKQFIKTLPFSLTNAQERALHEILEDIESPILMNRLLQGDVGSGKTAVASICLYATVTANNQGALMVPTEILAEQHYQSLKHLFGEKVNISLLTGSVKGKKREKILDGLAKNNIHLVVGTHALIQDDVVFERLGLVVVDEQHRFGVEQRRKLRDKGIEPDVLFMTATPIPRTLAITAFGDMDVSTIDELPFGRKTVETYWVKEAMFERVLKFIEKRLQNGEQAYVICPLIEESDSLNMTNVIDIYDQLINFYPSHINVGLMHGRLSSTEKDEVMRAFSNNEINILVSTTVVEVGVNVPNATVMVIYDAQQFGLSQLHQLRGRVGRGEKQSYCILIADPKGDSGKERMRIMTETNDGFELSEYDLTLRGPGDFFGKKQSGLPEFKVADLVHDYKALEVARRDAQQIIDHNYLEENSEYANLKKHIENESFFHAILD